MGLEAVLPGPQNALYVMLCYVKKKTTDASFIRTGNGTQTHMDGPDF